MTDETRRLAREVVTRDLLGPDVLFAADTPDDFPTPPGYELDREIGRGGGGVVYRGRHLDLGRVVAIKFLLDAGPADIERFRREARVTARLDQASIVKIYELGTVDERPFIAMQYLEGGNLADAQLDHMALVSVLREVAQALSHAHAAGIVHRDIKPANILLDREGRPYVADFGIARDLHGALGETMSRPGQIMGTPVLMPPEQARGDVAAVDARSDVYAIGATLYKMLTGRPPFEGAHLVDVLHAVIHDEPLLPRSRTPSIPPRLEEIVMRCLRKTREDRYQSMADVVAAFDALLATGDDTPTSGTWFRRLVTQREEAPAAAPVDDRRADPFWTDGMEIVREIAAWDADLYRVSGSLEPSFARLDAMRTRLDGLLDDRPDLAWARFYRGVALFRRGCLDEALEDMERSIDRVRDLAGASFELGRLYLALYLRDHDEARKHLSRTGITGSLKSAARRLEQAVIAFQEAKRRAGSLAPWHREYAAAVGLLAEDDFDGCAAACDRILALEPDREEVWKLRGDALRFGGHDPFESYDRAIEIRRSYREALLARAEAHRERGQLAEARAALTRAAEINPKRTDAHALLARTWLEAARADETGVANDAVAEGRRIAEAALARDPASYDAAIVLAELHLERGRHAEDHAWFDDALTTLATARELAGCQNRVNLLVARAHLQCVQRGRARGDDRRVCLETVLELAGHVAATVPDDTVWGDLREAAEREMAQLAP